MKDLKQMFDERKIGFDKIHSDSKNLGYRTSNIGDMFYEFISYRRVSFNYNGVPAYRMYMEVGLHSNRKNDVNRGYEGEYIKYELTILKENMQHV